jgi:hypothetical protein
MGVSLCLPRISRAEAPARIVKVSHDGFHAKVKSKLTSFSMILAMVAIRSGIMIGIVLLNN